MDGKQVTSPKSAKVHKKGGKGPKPKITKEQRKEKYTNIARNQRNKHMTRMRDKHIICYRCRQKVRMFVRILCPGEKYLQI
jgi:hypothetical protein